jgi:hypothetical protein
MPEPTTTSPDAYTRTCQACGRAYDSSDYDDPEGAPVWMQDNCPDCYATIVAP